MRRVRVPWRAVAAVAGAIVLAASGLLLAGAMPASSPEVDVTIATGLGETMVYTPQVAVAPAETTVRVLFENVSTQAHNLTFQAPISGATRTIVEPGTTEAILIRTPRPGIYAFVCTIHIDMTGMLEVR